MIFHDSKRLRCALCAAVMFGCGTLEHADAWQTPKPVPSGPAGPPMPASRSSAGTTVTFTTYVNDTCTQVPPQNSVVHLDVTKACNPTPAGSISQIACYQDKITYTNHPRSPDCSLPAVLNELPVGVCKEFPGPVRTWKYIDPKTYDCRTEPK